MKHRQSPSTLDRFPASSRTGCSGCRLEATLLTLTMTQFAATAIRLPDTSRARNPPRSSFSFFHLLFFFPAARYSHLRASSSLVICVATMADRRLDNYSVHTCTSRSLSLSPSISLSFSRLPPSRFASSLVLPRSTECVILRPAVRRRNKLFDPTSSTSNASLSDNSFEAPG